MENEEAKQEFEAIKGAIHERIASLDAPVRELLLSDEYIVKLSNILNSHGLNKEDCGKTEELTTNFLLGTIRPSEFEQVFTGEFPSLTKEAIRSLYNDIKVQILSKVWSIIESAWEEDDENEKIFAELVEMEDVPLPPNMQGGGAATVGEKLTKEVVESSRLSDLGIKTNSPEIIKSEQNNLNWENKVASVTPTVTEKSTRVESDRSVPKIPGQKLDPYREIPE